MLQRRIAIRKYGFDARCAGNSAWVVLRVLFLLMWAWAIQTANIAIAQHINPILPPLPCCEPNCNGCPSSVAACVPVPFVPIPETTISLDPNAAPMQQLTVHEAIRIALSNSEVVRNLGLVDAHSDVDIIRGTITTYDPRAAYAAAAGEWGIFDPLWTTEMQWDRIDIPPGTSFSGIGNRPPELDTADFYTSLEQLLPMGSRVRADYVTNYLFNPDNPPNLDPNPQYFSYAQFGLVQPLLQGLGVPVTMAPIRIAAAEAERTDWQFKQEVLALVRSVETAFWTLYSEQQNLRAIDEAIPLFREIVRVREQQAQTAAGTESEVARAVSEMLLYEQRRLDTLSHIAEQQLVLRNLMGLPVNDGPNFKLIALPAMTPPFETVGEAVMTAVDQRPDVLRQRIAVYVAQQERIVARDSLRPKLDFNAFWRINGLGEDLGESLDVIGQNDFHDWNLGFILQVPLGRRQGRADVRAAELLIQKERALLDQTAHQASYEVADAYRRIMWLYQQHRVSASRVEALTKWREGARAQFENPPPGVSTVLALELYLNNLRDFVEASIKSHAIVADYNSALARLEEVKGTLLETRLVEVAGDQTDAMPDELPTPAIAPLPDWMIPTPSPIPQDGSGSRSTAPPASPIAAAPPRLEPTLVNPNIAAVPPTVTASPAIPSPSPIHIPVPPTSDAFIPPVVAKPLTTNPSTESTSTSATNNQRVQQYLPSNEPVLKQSPNPSVAVGDSYGTDNQAPDLPIARLPQTMAPTETRHAQVPLPSRMRETVQLPPETIKLTLPPPGGSKQTQAPSQLMLRPDATPRDQAMHQQPATTKSVTARAVPSERRMPLFSTVPPTTTASPAIRSQSPIHLPVPPTHDAFTPPAAAKPVTINPSTESTSTSATKNQRVQQYLPSNEPVLKQSPNPSVAVGDAYGTDNQAPGLSKARLPQATAPATETRHAQVPLPSPMRETVQLPPETIKLTLPPPGGSKQTQAPSRLIVRPDVTLRNQAMHQQPATTKSVTAPALPSEKSAPRFGTVPQSNAKDTVYVAQQPGAPTNNRALPLSELYGNATRPTSATNNQRVQQYLPSNEPVLKQSPNPSVAVGDAYATDNQAPDLPKARLPQTMAPTETRHAQVPLPSPMRETVQLPPDTIKLTLPPPGGSKQTQAPSRLIVRPDVTLRDQAMHQQPATTKSVTAPALPSEKSAPRFGTVPQSNAKDTVRATNNQRLQQTLTFKEPVLTQSRDPSVAGGLYSTANQAPSSSEARILQTMAPATATRHAQVPLTIAMREIVQSPQDTIKLTLPPRGGSKQTQAPSRLIVRP